jgi:hypothetical protein
MAGTLASVHKWLRIFDLCKKLALGAHRANRLFAIHTTGFNGLCRRFLESADKCLRIWVQGTGVWCSSRESVPDSDSVGMAQLGPSTQSSELIVPALAVP